MSASAARAHEAQALTEPVALVESLLAGLAGAVDDLRFVSAPAPAVDVERAVSAIERDGFALVSPDGDAWVGLERAFEVPAQVSALGMRQSLVARLDALRASMRGTGVLPFAFGALPFDASREPDPAFDELGAGAFVVPRVAYVLRRGRAYVVATGRASDRTRIASLAGRLVRSLADAAPARHVHVVRMDDTDAARFGSSVARANEAIAAGELAKVVLARRTTLTLDAPIDVASLVRALGHRAPAAHRFALVRGDTAFVGATPERLVTCRDRRIATVALAGTTRPGAARELVASSKDRAEHHWVVDAIAAALEPLCESGLSVAREPRARELRDLVHLETQIDGTLRAGRDVFDVIEALHPTPAVGGTPRAAALTHIANAEPFGRGFYAAPLGVVDASGDADVVVALRSGVFRGCEANLFAGSGIVAGSVPEAELAETDLKLRSLLGALGDEPES